MKNAIEINGVFSDDTRRHFEGENAMKCHRLSYAYDKGVNSSFFIVLR